ncbi:MAG: RNA polymerase sigma factor [Bryobacteraceae bacterium]
MELTMALGEPSAAASFEQWLIAFERPVLRLCYRLLGNAADAEDAAQEVFLKAWRNRGHLDGRDPSPWLYQIAVNTCRDHYRRRRPAGEITGREEAPGCDPESLAGRQEREAMVMEGLAGLGERERMALVLRDLEGLATAEVAVLMGVSEATVRSQNAQARAKLREWISKRMAR